MTSPPLWQLSRGESPLIVNVPHAGTFLPSEIAERLTLAARATPDTDWHVDRLFDFAPGRDVTLMVATHSRIVVDLNRDPNGVALYPGASNTEVCPSTTFADQPHYEKNQQPNAGEVVARVARYWHPYHITLATEIARVQARHGYCIVLDAHSIASRVPRFFAGQLPDLNLGTVDSSSCRKKLEDLALARLSSHSSFSNVVNGRFKGGYITRHYGRPATHVHALQLEMAWSSYLDETRPHQYDPARATPLRACLRELVDGLLATVP